MLNADDWAHQDFPRGATPGISSLTRDAIRTALTQVALQHGRRPLPLADNLSLTRCGLNSFDMPVIVAMLEDSLGVNPFAAGKGDFPLTVAEWVRSYDRALARQMFLDLED